MLLSLTLPALATAAAVLLVALISWQSERKQDKPAAPVEMSNPVANSSDRTTMLLASYAGMQNGNPVIVLGEGENEERKVLKSGDVVNGFEVGEVYKKFAVLKDYKSNRRFLYRSNELRFP